MEQQEAQYRLDPQTGKAHPVNQAAWDECNAWNTYAAQINARTRAQEGRRDAPANH